MYIVRGLGHHGNRLYGFMRLWSKMWTGVGDGVEWSGVDTPQTVMTTRAPAVLKNDPNY